MTVKRIKKIIIRQYYFFKMSFELSDYIIRIGV